MALRYISVCSGIEAASVAWEPLGWEPLWFSEIDPFASAVLRHHFPTVENLGDMTAYKEWPDATPDLLVGGTPCQSFSVAGLRRGMEDPRGNLALVFLGVALKYRPRWVVWENVPGVLSSHRGRDFAAFVGGLVELGYGVSWRVLDAQYYGLAQRRKRVFVVGHLGDWRRAAAVLFEPSGLRWNPASGREAREATAPTLAARTRGGGGLRTDAELDGALIAAYGGNNTSGPIEVAAACNAHSGRLDFETETLIAATLSASSNPNSNAAGRRREDDETLVVAHCLKGNGFDASEDGTGRGTPLVTGTLPAEYGKQGGNGFANMDGGLIPFDTTQITSAINRSNPKPGDPSHPLAAGAHPPAIAFQANASSSQSMNPSEVTPSLDLGKAGAVSVHSGGAAVRRLTPREAERLQGFPDDWTLIPYHGKRKKPAKDGPRYKALGNSMAAPVMRWIGRRIKAEDSR